MFVCDKEELNQMLLRVHSCPARAATTKDFMCPHDILFVYKNPLHPSTEVSSDQKQAVHIKIAIPNDFKMTEN